MRRLQRIVVATDFSDCARRALDVAVALAEVHGARITLVHVCELPPEFGLAEVHGCEAEDRIARAVEAELEAAVEITRRRGVGIDGVVRRGTPWEKIHNLATDVGADLIVVGARGQRGMPHVFGSVAERVVRTASRPVLVVQEGSGCDKPARAG
jgi:nucleotide-binding universal stress UspA family protein